MSKNKKPIVFVSYARTNPKHVEDIVNFVNTLRKHGIDARMDEFDLKIGHDLFYFMEKIQSEADFVLLILNKEFCEKADKREGGVGTETQIMSKDVYGDVEQEKVIPIVWECDDNDNPYLPVFVKTRFYINLSIEKYGEDYELLLRTLHNKPKYPKEEVGEIPKWLEDMDTYYSATDSIINQFEYQVENHPERFNYFVEEFLMEYFEYLKTFEIEFSSIEEDFISKEIFKNLKNYELLKNDFVIFIEKMFKIGAYQEIDSQLIIDFLTNVFTLAQPNGKTYNRYNFSNFNFILIELFLYFIAFGLKYKNYALIGDLFYSPYFLEGGYGLSKETEYFVNLDNQSSYTDEILMHYFKIEHNQNYISVLGKLLYERVPSNLPVEFLIDADLLCCYVSYLDYDRFDRQWFPYMHIYKHRGRSFDLFRRLISQRFFNSVKSIFNVETVEEFKNKVISTRDLSLGKGEIYFTPVHGKVQPIEQYLDLEKICTER